MNAGVVIFGGLVLVAVIVAAFIFSPLGKKVLFDPEEKE
jgi:hypothetical protein